MTLVWPAEYAKRLAANLKTTIRLLPNNGEVLNSQEFPSAGMLPHHSAMVWQHTMRTVNTVGMIPATA